jgi:hypothetical protein
MKLTKEQEEYILANYHNTTLTDLSKKAKIGYQKIKDYLEDKGLKYYVKRPHMDKKHPWHGKNQDLKRHTMGDLQSRYGDKILAGDIKPIDL